MRIFCILIIGSFMFFTAGCASVKPAQVEHGCPYHVPQVTQVIRQQAPATSYQQWVILGTYVLTTIIMAIYTNKGNKKLPKNAKAANEIYRHSKWSSNIIMNMLRVLFRRGK